MLTIMEKKKYCPTTLNEYLNESKSITLKRKYGDKDPVTVGTHAPMRNQVLSYVAENVKVNRTDLKKFISNLNEGNGSPAATSMWLKRNADFFIIENKNNQIYFKLSNLGKRLAARLAPSELLETKTKKYDFLDDGKPGLHDEEKNADLEECGVDEEEELSEESKKRIKRIVEHMRANRLNEQDDKDKDKDDELSDEDLDKEDEEAADETDDEVEVDDEVVDDEVVDDEVVDDEVVDDEVEIEDEQVEIESFIITVDDVESALAELEELGITAERVTAEDSELEGGVSDVEIDDLEDTEVEGSELDDLGDVGDEDDFNLSLDGEIEGEPEEAEVDQELNDAEDETDEFEPDQEGGQKPAEDLVDVGDEELEGTEDVEDVADDVEAIDSEEADDLSGEEFEEDQIKVSAENWDAFKGWLEDKGVDIEEMFGGEIEVEGEDNVEDDINFDDLEDLDDETSDDEDEKTEDVEDEDEEKKTDDNELEEDAEDYLERVKNPKPVKRTGSPQTAADSKASADRYEQSLKNPKPVKKS